jgi:hypothetical protein
MVGRLFTEAEATVSRLRRVSRDKRTPAAVKVQAEQASWQVSRDMVRSLQSLGYLPMATAKISADLTHRIGDESGSTQLNAPEYEELAEEIERLRGIASASGGSGDGGPEANLLAELDGVKNVMQRLAVGERLRALAAPAGRIRSALDDDQTPRVIPEHN